MGSDPERVSLSTTGAQAQPDQVPGSARPALSADGRHVAFVSGAPDLVAGDTNEKIDVFVRDRLLGTTERVSVSTIGQEGNAHSSDPSISADGRYIAFASVASNLVPGDTNSFEDVFVHDRLTGETVRISSDSVPISRRYPRISSTGRYVAFVSLIAFSSPRLTVHDRDGDGNGIFDEPGTTSTRALALSSALLTSYSSIAEPSISADARFLAFQLHGIFTDGRWTRVLLHDRDPDENGTFDETGSILTIHVSGDYGDTAQLTPDGRYLAFSGLSSSLVPSDTNGIADVFVYDRLTEAMRRVSVTSAGGEGFDARLIGSHFPAISANGRFVAFVSYAPLVADDLNFEGDVFVHDRDADADGVFDEPNAIETRRVSVGPGGAESSGGCENSVISADGRYVGFASFASDLVIGDTNGLEDVFVVDLNRAPQSGAIAPAATLVAVNTALGASASFVDADRGDTHTALWSWGDGTTSTGAITESGGSGTISGTHSYAEAGVYTVTLTVRDPTGASTTSRYEYVVAYDPTGGFVTGNGMITSPAGAFRADLTITGPARVSFVSKYQQGAGEPVGNAAFDFRLADLSFRSESYAWLVVAGSRAQLKGTGRINGNDGYGFMLTATDGDLIAGRGADKVRVKIWELITGAIVYDNQFGAADDAAAASEISGGSIVIHK